MPVCVGWLRLRYEHCRGLAVPCSLGNPAGHHAIVQLLLALRRRTRRRGKTSTPLQETAPKMCSREFKRSGREPELQLASFGRFSKAFLRVQFCGAHLAAAPQPYSWGGASSQHSALLIHKTRPCSALRQMATAMQAMWQGAVADTLKGKTCLINHFPSRVLSRWDLLQYSSLSLFTPKP